MRNGFALSLLTALVVLLLTAPVSPAQTASDNALTPEQLSDGWISLFDGESLFGWRTPDAGAWKVADGTIQCDTDQPTMLYTTSQFGDFEISMECSSDDAHHAVLAFRTSPSPTAFKEGGGYGVKLHTAQVFGLSGDAEGIDVTAPWRTVTVSAFGGKIRAEVDGRCLGDVNIAGPLGRGYIALVAQGPCTFKNIRLRPLGSKKIFNGKDLTGWNTFPELPTKVEVTEKGEMKITNGSGMVETAEAYDDFTFQTEVFIAVPDINSGVFFRCIPGDKMNGYEAQLNNNCIDGDLTQPADCGTGGIFRRQNARRIVAEDQKWFHFTIHADDKHFATWVNGIQVCDWSDTRVADPNPRRGLRQEPGTIQFQGHDPTTEVLFRNIQIAPLPSRR